jgi:hypothetical protein
MLVRGTKDKEHAMAEALKNSIAFVGIDVGKNSFHVVGLDECGAIVLLQKWSRGLARGEVPVMMALRLFVPESWTSNPVRLKRADVPVEYRTARTKPEIALAEIDRVIAAGVRFGCALADAGYGLSAPFRQGLTARSLVPTFLGTWVELLVHACKETAERRDQEKGFVTVASKADVSLSSDSGY